MSPNRPASSEPLLPVRWLSPRLLLVLGMLAAVGHMLAHAGGLRLTALVLKPVPVWLLVLWVASARRSRYTVCIALGLLFGSLGDILLELSPHLFVHGLGAFLVGHLFYLGAFSEKNRRLRPLLLLPLLLGSVGIVLLCGEQAGPLVGPIVVYCTALSCVAWRAMARVTGNPLDRPDQWAGAIGAVLFTLSDGLIALNRFYAPVPYSMLAIMSTYWFAQLGISRSAHPAATK